MASKVSKLLFCSVKAYDMFFWGKDFTDLPIVFAKNLVVLSASELNKIWVKNGFILYQFFEGGSYNKKLGFYHL